jgi:hypothetical protein
MRLYGMQEVSGAIPLGTLSGNAPMARGLSHLVR